MIISRYLIKEVFLALFGVAFVMLLIFLSNQLIRYLKYAANGKIAANVVLQLMGLEIPYLLVLLLPLGLFLGIIFAYGRLYADNELRVMQSCGLSTQRLMAITGFCGALVAIVVMGLALWVNPYLAMEKHRLLKKNISTENILDLLIPGRFQVSSDDARVVYVESIDRDRQGASNIFIAEQKKDVLSTEVNTWSVLSASRGYQETDPKTHDRFVVAAQGYRYEGTPGEREYKIIQFDKYAIRLPEQPNRSMHQVEEGMPSKVLWDKYDDPKNAAELQWRLSMPISAFLLAMLAIPFSFLKPRQSRYAQIFPAILIYIIYLNLLFVTRDWIENNELSPWLGMWLVHLGLVGIIALVFAIRSHLPEQLADFYRKHRSARRR